MRRLARLLCATALLGALWAPSAEAFGLKDLEVGFTDSLGAPVTEAGSHPYAWDTTLAFETRPDPGLGFEVPEGSPRTIRVSAPPGLIANPTVTPRCTTLEFLDEQCPPGSQVGVTDVTYGGPETTERLPVYNLAAPPRVAAKLGFFVADTVPVTIEGSLNPDPPYNVIASINHVSQALPLYAATTTLWGNPASPVHDAERPGGAAAGIPERAFLTLPRSCPGTPLQFGFLSDSWESPGAVGPDGRPELSDPDWVTGNATSAPISDCAALGFDPELAAAPTTTNAAAPSGFEFSIDVSDPGLLEPDELAGSDLRKAVVTLPEGITVNPASADGLEACSPAQLAAETAGSDFGAGCPAASKLAEVAVTTPLLDEQLGGAVFLATPYENPLGSLLAGYLVLKSPERGVVVRLAGKIEADPETGRLTAGFDQNPQLPFSHLEVSFKTGNRAPLITPPTCGTYQIVTELHPWSGNPPVSETDSFTIDHGPDGGPCLAGDPGSPGDPAEARALPFPPSFEAGTISPIAATYSPLVVRASRPDGSQLLRGLDLDLPQGLTGRLAGATTCPQAALDAAAANSGRAEQAAPSCPAGSRLGTLSVGAGAGPTPFHVQGTAYLAPPYRGAPLSVAVITPAVAGPFDLGTVVVRAAVAVDPRSAEISVSSDPLPRILQGIPLALRSLHIDAERPQFTLNPTSCDPLGLSGTLFGSPQVAVLHSRFQLAECTRLDFRPKMALRLRGATRRGGHPALTVTLQPRPGDANIASLSLALPRSEFLEQAHIGTVCTRVQFAADQCPPASVYGTASVQTPLLDYPLAGNLYLRSSDNELPDLVPDLRGPAHQPLRLEAAGRTDSIRGGIRNTFDFIPDAPFTRLTARLAGARKGLLVNSRDLCARTYRATVRYTAHNGDTYTDHPLLKARCRKRGEKGKRGGRGKRGPKRTRHGHPGAR
jgi:hypothetical protein